MIKDIAKIGIAAALVAAAPLAFAQTTGSTGNGSTNSTGALYPAGTGTNNPSAATNNTSGTAGSASSATSGTSSTGMTGSTSTTPGVPNTGAGGDAASNALMLIVSGVVALGGIGYLATRRGMRA